MVSRRAFGYVSIGATVAAFVRGSSAGAADPVNPKGVFPVNRTPEEWKKILTKEQYYVMRDHGTERAFTSPLDKTYAPGQYTCAG